MSQEEQIQRELAPPGKPDADLNRAAADARTGKYESLVNVIVARIPGMDAAGAQALIDDANDPNTLLTMTELLGHLRLWEQDDPVGTGVGVAKKDYSYKVGPGGEVFAWDPATGTLNTVGTYPGLADAVNFEFVTDATTGHLYAVDPAKPTEFIFLGKRGFAEIDPERDFAEGIRQFDNQIKESARQFNTTEERLRGQFAASFQENQRQFDLGFSENQRQFGITEGRLLQRDIGQLGLGLGQLSQQEAEYARQVMKDPTDFLSRAFATRGEVSPLTEVTQADLINSLRQSFADIGRFTDEQIAASQARLVAPAMSEIQRPQLEGPGLAVPTGGFSTSETFTEAPPPPEAPPATAADDTDTAASEADSPASRLDEPSGTDNGTGNGTGNGNGNGQDDAPRLSVTPQAGSVDDPIFWRWPEPVTPRPRLVQTSPGQPIPIPVTVPIPSPIRLAPPKPFDPFAPGFDPNLLAEQHKNLTAFEQTIGGYKKGGRLRNPAYQDGGRMNAGVGIVGDSSDGKENRELLLLDPGSSATIIPEDQLPKDALRGRLKIRGYQEGGGIGFVNPPGGFHPQNEVLWVNLGNPTNPPGAWARHPDDPRQFGMQSMDANPNSPTYGQATIHQTRVNTPEEQTKINQRIVAAWGGPEAASRLGQVGPGRYGDPTDPYALRRYQLMSRGPQAQQEDINFELMVDPNDPSRFQEVPIGTRDRLESGHLIVDETGQIVDNTLRGSDLRPEDIEQMKADVASVQHAQTPSGFLRTDQRYGTPEAQARVERDVPTETLTRLREQGLTGFGDETEGASKWTGARYDFTPDEAGAYDYRLAETRGEDVTELNKGGRLRNIPRYQEGGSTDNPYNTNPTAPPTNALGMGVGFEDLPTEQIKQTDLISTAKRYQPPAVRDLLAGKRPQFLEPGGRTGQRLFSPQQLGRLTPDEQAALRTRLAVQNLSLDDFIAAQQQRYINPRQRGRGRLVFQ